MSWDSIEQYIKDQNCRFHRDEDGKNDESFPMYYSKDGKIKNGVPLNQPFSRLAAKDMLVALGLPLPEWLVRLLPNED